MQLGFVSAILPDLNLDEVFAFAADEGFGCVELMCWPPGGADRRYAGVTHIDVTAVDDALIAKVRGLVHKTPVCASVSKIARCSSVTTNGPAARISARRPRSGRLFLRRSRRSDSISIHRILSGSSSISHAPFAISANTSSTSTRRTHAST